MPSVTGRTVCIAGATVAILACQPTTPHPAQLEFPTLAEEPGSPAADNEAAERSTSPPPLLFPIDRDLGDPRTVARLELSILVPDHFAVPNRVNQRVEPEPFDLTHVTITAEAGELVLDGEREANLELAVASRRLGARAHQVTRGATTDRERVDRLVRWLHGNIEYRISDHSGPSETLALGTGDCSEFSDLFVQMARAAGVPARRVVGLAYTRRGGRPGFGFHAWAEVAVSGHWVAVDPTWNEPLADATHLRLGDGDGDRWAYIGDEVEIWIHSVARRPAPSDPVDFERLTAELPVHMRLPGARPTQK